MRGLCQGVGFRPWVFRLARELGIDGLVRNAPDGVRIAASGPASALEALRSSLLKAPPPGARVESVSARPCPPRAAPGFRIAPSETGGPRRSALVPDLPTCEACLREMRDPGSRRFGYALLTCCECGPRFTLARALPFDRPSTGMADFPLCADCRAEHADPGDRRFHAQTQACPRCGPRLRLLEPSGRALGVEDPLAEAARRLAKGGAVAIKGIGGFHLACDATDARAVSALRAAKRRPRKPFAVMVGDLAAAARLARLDASERALLASPERPVVLARRRPAAEGGAELAAGVAPGSSFLGLLLPYTPIHHVLLGAVARPLVMTSGNRSGEPIVRSEGEALARLGEAAELFLVHERPIERRCDDSVARVVGGRPTRIRRARGAAPRSIRLPRPVAAPVLACGGAWKNAFALVEEGDAWLSPHVGDLESVEACEAFDESVADLEGLLGIRPRRVAHDLHPAYYTTRYARRRPGTRVAVAHHHAHAVSVMAEHGLEGPALALVWDGTGLGPDGTAWGGELLRVEAAGFERLATFRPLALPGADRAIREPWRIALASLDELFEGEPPLAALPLFRGLPEERLRAVRRVARSERLAPRAHGAGRLFDAAAALLLDFATACDEGEAALALESAAGGDVEAAPYAYRVEVRDGLPTLDFRPALRALVAERLDGVEPARIADRFHATLAEAGAQALRDARAAAGRLPLLAGGGCFQNDLLVRGLRARLGRARPLRTALELPPGDGGLALGQAVVADARLRREEV